MIFSLALLTLMGVVSCNKDEDKGYDTFRATMEVTGDKTTIGDDNWVKWEADDEVRVTNTLTSTLYKAMTGGSGSTTLTRVTTSGSDIYGNDIYAVYPASIYANYHTVTLPQTQIYDATRKIQGFPMYAKAKGSQLNFKNLCSVVKFTLTNGGSESLVVKRIIITTDKGVWGTFPVDSEEIDNNDGTVDTVYKVVAKNGESNNTLMLECGNISIAVGSSEDFYVYIPTGTYSTFEVSVYTDQQTVANFNPAGDITAVRNTIHGVARNSNNLTFEQIQEGFSVDEEGTRVRFADGNVQYTTTAIGNNENENTGTWSIASSEYSVIGASNTGIQVNDVSNPSTAYLQPIDLFGYGTSGWVSYDGLHKPTAYLPWAYATIANNYCQHDLSDDYAAGDWGTNYPKAQGETKGWRTLSAEEWDYLLNHRQTASGHRYAHVKVNGVTGIVIFPDAANWPSDVTRLDNKCLDKYAQKDDDRKSLSLADWGKLKSAGFAFLPYGGYRTGAVEDGTVALTYSVGFYYWTSTMGSYIGVELVGKGKQYAFTVVPYNANDDHRAWGMAVRLVQNY